MGEYVAMKVYQSALDEIWQLREQNRVLARYLEQARDSAKQVHSMAMKNVCPNPDTITMENVAIDHLEFLDRLLRAALTATSQPVKPAGKMHACDIPGCVSCGNPEDATSQEGQHESR